MDKGNCDSRQFQAGIYNFRATVKGRTPARIVAGEIGKKIVYDPMKLLLPPEYNQGPIIAPPETLLLEDEWFDIYPAGVDIGAFVRQHREDMHFDPNQFICFYGRVLYEDVFPKLGKDYKPHETGWCYGCFINEPEVRLRTAGPWAYSQRS